MLGSYRKTSTNYKSERGIGKCRSTPANDLECTRRRHIQEGKQQPSLSKEKSCQLPQRHKGPKLSSSGTTNPGLRGYVMGLLHQIKHPTVGSRPNACSKICDRGLQSHQQPSQMIADLGWEPLYQRRANFKLVMVYRITYGLIDIPAPLYLHPSALSTRGHTLRYMIPYCRTDVYRNSFSHQQSGYGTSCRRLL